MEAAVVPARRLEQRVRADDVRVEERARVVERVVVVRLRGVVHDGVHSREELVDEGRVGDVALDEREPVGRKSIERGAGCRRR